MRANRSGAAAGGEGRPRSDFQARPPVGLSSGGLTMDAHQNKADGTDCETLLKDHPSFPFDDLDDPVIADLAHVVGQYRAVQASWEQEVAAGRRARQELTRVQEAER